MDHANASRMKTVWFLDGLLRDHSTRDRIADKYGRRKGAYRASSSSGTHRRPGSARTRQTARQPRGQAPGRRVLQPERDSGAERPALSLKHEHPNDDLSRDTLFRHGFSRYSYAMRLAGV